MRTAAIGQNSYVSVGLVVALVGAALFYGQQLQRLDAMESRQQEFRQEVTTELRELRAEVRDLRGAFVRQQSAGR